jgi:ubiquinol-cytochrome c reductase cytochrome c1 subunit
VSQICSVIYFAFFLLMPVYRRWTRPNPFRKGLAEMKIRGISLVKKLLAAALFARCCCRQRPELHLDKAPVSRSGCAGQRRQAVRQLLPELPRRQLHALQPAAADRSVRADDQGQPDVSADKVGEPMRIAMQREEAKVWFGAAPPDLTVIARSRASEFGSGADWLYTYLRGFYRDSKRRPAGTT